MPYPLLVHAACVLFFCCLCCCCLSLHPFLLALLVRPSACSSDIDLVFLLVLLFSARVFFCVSASVPPCVPACASDFVFLFVLVPALQLVHLLGASACVSGSVSVCAHFLLAFLHLVLRAPQLVFLLVLQLAVNAPVLSDYTPCEGTPSTT